MLRRGKGAWLHACTCLTIVAVTSPGGLPDLLLWRTTPHKEAHLLEVKGPTDRLSEQQRAWIACIAAAGMQIQVCKVVEPQA